MCILLYYLVYNTCCSESVRDCRKHFISGFGVLKKCCAVYSVSKGKLDKAVGEAIVQAADEVRFASVFVSSPLRLVS